MAVAVSVGVQGVAVAVEAQAGMPAELAMRPRLYQCPLRSSQQMRLHPLASSAGCHPTSCVRWFQRCRERAFCALLPRPATGRVRTHLVAQLGGAGACGRRRACTVNAMVVRTNDVCGHPSVHPSRSLTDDPSTAGLQRLSP